MKKLDKNKLKLRTETVRLLNGKDLGAVVGGGKIVGGNSRGCTSIGCTSDTVTCVSCDCL